MQYFSIQDARGKPVQLSVIETDLLLHLMNRSEQAALLLNFGREWRQEKEVG